MSERPRSSDTATAERVAARRDLVSRVKSLWQQQQRPDALAFLGKHASVRNDRALSLEVAYEEYCIRRDRGERIDVSSYCSRFPTISRSLHRQIEVDEYVRKDPSIIGRHVSTSWPRRGDELFGVVVVEEIGRGAFARAYLCGQPGIGNRQVVVKVSPGSAIEADTMGGLDHPNIMPIYSAQRDTDTDLTGICMPFVGRSTLYDVIDIAFGQGNPPQQSAVIQEASRALVRRGDRYHELTPRVELRSGAPYQTGVLQLMLQIAEALAHAHERGVLHGDVKPSNIVMSITGIPLLVDFNLSQKRDSNNLVTGGTLPYMAPEQIRTALLGSDEQDRVDERSDVFSWGVILFELLTGRLPFEAVEVEEEPVAAAGRMLDAQSEGAVALRARMTTLDRGLADVLTRCLAFDPAQRPASMDAVADQVRRYLSVSHRLRRYLRQHRRQTRTSLIIVATLAMTAMVWWSQQPPLRDRRFQQALVDYRQQDYAAAVASLSETIAQDNRYGDAYLARGCAALQQYELDGFQGWLDAAFRDFTLAVRYGSSNEAQKARAFCLVRMNDFAMADLGYEAILRQGPATPDVLNNLAVVKMKLSVDPEITHSDVEKLLLEADRLLRTAIPDDPDLWQLHLNLALLELKRFRLSNGDYLPQDGLTSIRRMVQLNPNDSATFFFAARLVAIFAKLDDDPSLYAECIDYAESAVRLGHRFSADVITEEHPFSRVVSDPRFQALLKSSSSPRTPSAADRFVLPRVLDTFGRIGQPREL